MLALEFEQLKLAYGQRIVFRDGNLKLRSGECLAVLGANGLGKSTLLRAILGLVTPQAGTITLFGQAVQRGSSMIGYLPQVRQTSTHHRLSGRAWLTALAQGCQVCRRTSSQRDALNLEAIIELVQAQAFIDRPFIALSGGERQRLLLAQALLYNPKMLLLDEPLTYLDVDYQVYLATLIKQLCQQKRLSVVLATHAVQPLKACVDQILHLSEGGAYRLS